MRRSPQRIDYSASNKKKSAFTILRRNEHVKMAFVSCRHSSGIPDSVELLPASADKQNSHTVNTGCDQSDN